MFTLWKTAPPDDQDCFAWLDNLWKRNGNQPVPCGQYPRFMFLFHEQDGFSCRARRWMKEKFLRPV